jgi:rhodanese-related sulfurtransferase
MTEHISEASFNMKLIGTLLVILFCGITGDHPATSSSALGQAKVAAAAKAKVELITADELKAKLAKNELVTIIDVRASQAYADSDTKIKGAIHVKLRRLKSRLAFPPLNSVPRYREIITYCACPSEETSLAAAQVLVDAGFKRVRALKGGWDEWRKVNGQVEARPKAM